MKVWQTIVELCGFAAICVAAFLVSTALGFLAVGASLVAIGNAPLGRRHWLEEMLPADDLAKLREIRRDRRRILGRGRQAAGAENQ